MRTILMGSLAAGLLALAAQGAVADDTLRLANAGFGATTLRLDGIDEDADNVLVFRRGYGGYYGGYRGGYGYGGYRGGYGYGGYRGGYYGGGYGGYRSYGYYGGYRPYYGGYGSSYYPRYYGGSYYGGYSPYSYSSYYYGCSADIATMPSATPLGVAPRSEPYATYPYNGDPRVVPPSAPRQPVAPKDGLLVSAKGDARYQFHAYGEDQAAVRLPATSGGFALVNGSSAEVTRVSLSAATTGGVIGIIER